MIRSNRSIRRACMLLIAMLVVAVTAPAGALAQNIQPTDEEYGNGVVGVAASGDSGSSSGGSSSISSLPFTGLDVVAIAAIGAGLVGAGFMVRRASRSSEEPL
jgi:hypothetical protein